LFSQNQRSGRISLSSLNNILSKAKVTANQIELVSHPKNVIVFMLTLFQIMQIVAPNGTSYVTQSEFNTAIALTACAQNSMEVSLDSVFKNKNCKIKPNTQ
jgi:hypothetical protein